MKFIKHLEKMTDLSIIIVSYNTLDLLRDCLISVGKALKPKNGMEVIVVDNNSTDGSQAMVKKEFPSVKLIANKKNLGFAAANNRGVKYSDGKYLLFLNSDTKVYKESLAKPLKYLKNHPEVGAITVRLVLANGEIDPDNHRGYPTPWTSLTHFAGLSKAFPQSRIFNNYYQSYRNFSSIHAIDVTAGSYMMMPRKLFESLNGWDETYFFYGEDIDLSCRIRQTGKKIIYYPKVEVLHYKGASSGIRKESQKISTATKETKIRTAKESVRAMEIFYKKFFANKYPGWITFLVMSGIRLKGSLRIFKYQLGL
jgi:GT2 family glycosyltransferase